MKYFKSIIVAIVVFSSSVGATQAASTDEAERYRLVQELFDVFGMKRNLVTLTTDILKLEFQKRLQNNPRISEKTMAEVFVILTDTFEESAEDVLHPMAKLYVDSFTADELRAIVVFQRSPAGQKAARLFPTLTQKGMVLGAKWGKKVGEIAARRIQAKLKEKGIDI